MRIRPRRAIPALFCVLTGLITGHLTAPAQAAAAPLFREYVALGDSWSADSTPNIQHVAVEEVPFGCLQASYNYPKQVATALRVPTFRDATCGSADTTSLADWQSVPLWDWNPPQFDRLTPTTDLVTLGMGGNDVGLAGAVMGCLNLLPSGNPCQSSWVVGGIDQLSVRITEAQPKMAAAIDGIRARSPRATILLVDYLQAVPRTGCWPTVPIAGGDITWLRAKLEEFNAMLRRVAAAKSVRFVDTYATSAGHDFCQSSGTNWIEGLLPVSGTPLGIAAPFHPNRLGADHQAVRVLEEARR